MRRPLQTIQGMSFGTLFRVLKRNGFSVESPYLGRFLYLIAMGALNSILSRCEKMAYGHRIETCVIKEPPLFIIGHWRSGTTHLHNLLSIDENFTFPTAYEAMFPLHFVFSQPSGPFIFDLIAPSERPMDDLPFSANVPHEDEFALAALSTVSPYMRFLFPLTGDHPYSVLDPERLPEEDLERWKASLVYFLKKLTYLKGKRILLKSPAHLGRVRTLLELFPEAKFIHIVRNPYEVYHSTRKLWEECLAYSHLQTANPERVDDIILRWYKEIFSLFQRDRALIPAGSLHEMKFEDLEKAPESSLQQIYEGLGLPGFDCYRKRVYPYLKGIKGYRKNHYFMDTLNREKIRSQCRSIFERYDYPI